MLSWLGRWLDPPEVRARNAAIKAGLLPRPEPLITPQVGIVVPVGCLVPVALGVAVLLGVGVLLERARSAPSAPLLVRVIDDGAPGGPAVVATALVPLR